MKLEWSILQFPRDPRGYHAVYFTEGMLRVTVDDVQFV